MRNPVEIRNPVLTLESVRKLQTMPLEVQGILREVLLDIRKESLANADKSWKKHKAPMAAYWKAVGVYSGHIARSLRKGNV